MSEKKIIAYILLNVALGKERELKSEIEKINHVTEVKIVYGEYDIVIRVKVPTFKILDKIVSTIRRLNGVLKSITLIATG